MFYVAVLEKIEGKLQKGSKHNLVTPSCTVIKSFPKIQDRK